MSEYTPMEIKAARSLNKQMADDFEVDEQDQWNRHAEEMKAIARVTLEACGANAVLKALEAYNLRHRTTHGLEGAWDSEITQGEAAIAKVTTP